MIPTGNIIAWDTETTGLDPWHGDRPFAFSFCNWEGQTGYVEFPVDPSTRAVLYDKRVFEISDFVRNPEIRKVGHNLKFDVRHSEIALGVRFAGQIDETMFMAHVANPAERSLSLKALGVRHAGVSKDDENRLAEIVKACRRVAKKLDWKINEGEKEAYKADYWLPAALARVPEGADLLEKYPDMATACEKYATLDAVRTMLLTRLYADVLEREHLLPVYELERKLWPIVYEMETRGVRVDLGINELKRVKCGRALKFHRAEVEKEFGPFNKKVSPRKIREYLFVKLQLPLPDRTTEKTDEPSTERDVLEEYETRAPAVRHLISYDKHYKAKGTYFDLYATKHDHGTMHGSYSQLGAVTGRFSCRTPNLMNVPKRAAKGDIMKEVRAPFGPRKGNIWLHLDYKTIEPKTFAEAAGEEDMLAVFEAGEDIYRDLVNRIAQISGYSVEYLDQLFRDFSSSPDGTGGARDCCKIQLLAWLYGEGLKKMIRQTGLAEHVAEKVIAALKGAYSRAQEFMWEMQNVAKRDGHIINLYGRRIPIPPPFWDKKKREWIKFNYKATNYLIQSTAADLMKRAMVRCATLAPIVMTIHDELVFEVGRADLTVRLVRQLQDAMKDHDGVFKRVKIETDIAVTTRNWDEPRKVNL